MKTIQMVIDEDLLADVDRVIAEIRTTRSAFIRSALSLALRQYRVQLLERRHAEGYARAPVAPGEFER